MQEFKNISQWLNELNKKAKMHHDAPLSKITDFKQTRVSGVDEGTGVDPEVVESYAVALTEDDARFPALRVFEIDGKWTLVDGHHRYHAMKKAGIEAYKINVNAGMTIADAELAGLAFNKQAGKGASPADIGSLIRQIAESGNPDFMKAGVVNASAIARWAQVSTQHAGRILKDLVATQTEQRNAEIRRLHEEGLSNVEIGKKMGMTNVNVGKILKTSDNPKSPPAQPEAQPEATPTAQPKKAKGDLQVVREFTSAVSKFHKSLESLNSFPGGYEAVGAAWRQGAVENEIREFADVLTNLNAVHKGFGGDIAVTV